MIVPSEGAAVPGERSSPKRHTTLQRAPDARLLPEMTTTVPPLVGPLLGLDLLTTGGA